MASRLGPANLFRLASPQVARGRGNFLHSQSVRVGRGRNEPNRVILGEWSTSYAGGRAAMMLSMLGQARAMKSKTALDLNTAVGLANCAPSVSPAVIPLVGHSVRETIN